ncbi:MAG: T9SS type A sorting domain-containing protein [Saprospiraceae bacterium]
MDGGFNFYPTAEFPGGVNYIQGYYLLPLSSKDPKTVFIYGTPKVHTAPVPGGNTLSYIELKYAFIDMSLNAGLGKVTQRDIVFSMDTLMPTQIGVTRHGNGRDWWLMAPYHLGNRFLRFILDPDGLRQIGKQDISSTDLGLGHTCFSPDGNWYARFNWHGVIPDSSFATIELYAFDRCSGKLSNRVGKTYDLSGLAGKPGGVAFSPNSRYLYVTRWDSIFQYDLQAPDIIASEVTVAVYDLFADTLGLPTRFFYPLLAPDNKIYVCVSNYNSQYLHVIEQPDSAGLACQVRQHALRLPVYNNFLLPNMPYYRLGKWVGSPCDTLGIIAVGEAPKEAGFSVFPNPASDQLQIQLNQPLQSEAIVEIADLTGRVIMRQKMPENSPMYLVQTGELQTGTYYLRIFTDSQLLGIEKIIIAN